MPGQKAPPTTGSKLDHRKLARTLIVGRARKALEDPEELEHQVKKHMRRLQRGRLHPRAPNVPYEDVVREVKKLHERRPWLTFTDVCNQVSRKAKYPSGRRVRTIARAVKWPDPRRMH